MTSIPMFDNDPEDVRWRQTAANRVVTAINRVRADNAQLPVPQSAGEIEAEQRDDLAKRIALQAAILKLRGENEVLEQKIAEYEKRAS